MFPDYENIFVDEEEFNRMKIEQTRQNEDITDKKDIALIKAIQKFRELGYNNTQISNFIGLHKTTIGEKLKKVVV